MNLTGQLQFNIQIGNMMTRNVQPILHEIRHALENLLNRGETGIIDLRTIPLAPGEEESIIDSLGKGEIQAKLDALGPSEIYETAYTGVWLTTHYNENEEVVSRFIEITTLPDILRSQQEDMSIALTRLKDKLTTDKADYHAETDS